MKLISHGGVCDGRFVKNNLIPAGRFGGASTGNHIAGKFHEIAKIPGGEIVKNRDLMTGQKRDFVWIGDVINANLKAMSVDSHGVFNVGSGESESFNAVVAALNSVLHTKLEPEYIHNPYSFFQNHTEADISSARKVLGYAPTCGLMDGIRAYHASGRL